MWTFNDDLWAFTEPKWILGCLCCSETKILQTLCLSVGFSLSLFIDASETIHFLNILFISSTFSQRSNTGSFYFLHTEGVEKKSDYYHNYIMSCFQIMDYCELLKLPC